MFKRVSKDHSRQRKIRTNILVLYKMFIISIFQYKTAPQLWPIQQTIPQSQEDRSDTSCLSLSKIPDFWVGVEGGGLICHSSFGNITLTQNSNKSLVVSQYNININLKKRMDEWMNTSRSGHTSQMQVLESMSAQRPQQELRSLLLALLTNQRLMDVWNHTCEKTPNT